MPKLIMMVGIAAAGKTTFARKLQETTYPEAVYVSTDEIREQVFGDASIQRDPQKIFYLAAEQVAEAFNENKDVIFDATNIKVKDRCAFFATLASFDVTDYQKIAYVFEPDPERSIMQDAMRERHVSEAVIHKQARNYQAIGDCENFAEIITVVE